MGVGTFDKTFKVEHKINKLFFRMQSLTIDVFQASNERQNQSHFKSIIRLNMVCYT